MPIAAGQSVTADQLNRLQPRPYNAAATAALVGTATYAAIPGCSIPLTTTAAGATWTATGVFDCSVTTTNTTALMVGRLVVDGASEAELAVHAMDTLDRDTVAMVWSGTLASAGAHTLALEGVVTGGAGTFQIYTSLNVTVTEVI